MASSVRVLHSAGFRFDSPSWEGPEGWVALRNQDLWQTFETVLSLCHSEKVDFLFLAGNLFEQEYVRKETVERVAKSFAKLTDTKIFVAPGERDPLVTTSAYRLAVWPLNVHIFSGEMSSMTVSSHNATVYGAGWTAYRQDEPFLDGFRARQDGTLQLMLLHAGMDSESHSRKFRTIRSEQIASSGLTYLALGHQDLWSGIQQEGGTFWADCGSPEARSFQESGPHGVILGEIEKGSAQFEFRELGTRRYIEKTLAIPSDQSNIEDLTAKLLAETSPQERQNNLFRIRLSGPIRDAETYIPALQQILTAKFRYVEVIHNAGSQSQLEQDVVTIRQPLINNEADFYTLPQVFMAKLQERLDVVNSPDDYKHWEFVQKIGLAALGQGREKDED